MCFDTCFFFIDIIFFNKHPNILEMLIAKERYCTITLLDNEIQMHKPN